MNNDNQGFVLIRQQQQQQQPPSSAHDPSYGAIQPTLFTLCEVAPSDNAVEPPSQVMGDRLIQAAYYYVQARYCIVDWNSVREWHRKRDTLFSASSKDDAVVRTGEYSRHRSLNSLTRSQGAFFVWLLYAIGTQLTPGAETSAEVGPASSKKLLNSDQHDRASTTERFSICVPSFNVKISLPFKRSCAWFSIDSVHR